MKGINIFRRISKIGNVTMFVRISNCIVCIFLIIVLSHFCIVSNKVQTHEFDFSWHVSDTFLLDSISVSIIYPPIESQAKRSDLQIWVSCFVKGNRMSYSSPKKYYLRDGNLLDSIIGNIKLTVKAQADGKESLIKAMYADLSDISESKNLSVYRQYIGIKRDYKVIELFFAQPKTTVFPDRFNVANIFYGNFSANFFSPFNLQKRCVKIRMDSLRKSNLTIDFNAPFNISDFTYEPDSKEFEKLHFNEGKTLRNIYTSKGFSATFDILPYEGLQTTRNMFIGIVIPMLISCFLYQFEHLKQFLK